MTGEYRVIIIIISIIVVIIITTIAIGITPNILFYVDRSLSIWSTNL